MAQVTSGSFTTTAYSGRSLTFSWSLKSQSIADNTSTISWSFAGSGTGTSWMYTQNSYLNINGARVYTQAAGTSIQLRPGTVVASGETVIAHGTDGKKTFNANGGGGIFQYSTIQTGSGNWELPQIPRAATLTAAPHFNDEENPTITYSNPAGEAVESLQACIANEAGTVVYADYRDISKTGSSYTFELTDQERNNLRWATINSPNLTVKFYVTTMIGGNRYESTLDKIMTIANAEPTLVASAYDNGGTSTALTGDNNIIIKGFNYIVASQEATAYKGATIKKQTISCGGQVIEGTFGAFENAESGEIIFSATDSRGKTTTQTVAKQVIEYVKLTCNLEVKNPNAEGETTVKISGNYFNGSFGAQDNTLAIAYRYKENDGEYGEWKEATASISGNTYSISIDEKVRDYRLAYTFQARAIDKINTGGILSVEKKVKSIPIFDWGENDFKFNVDVYDKNKNPLGTTIVANDYQAITVSGKSLLESGWVIITPAAANTPTAVYVSFKRHYNKIPVVIPTPSTGVIGTQVLGASVNGITNDGVNLVLTRANTTPTTVYYYVYGEVE